jgi:RNA polymerase sigma factor (sigma-70 family)
MQTLCTTDVAEDLVQTRWSLIRRLKDWDDQESWQEFFNTYWRLIYSMASKSGLTHTESEEVVQETIMAVCRKIGEFRADPAAGSFKSWLLTLIRWRIGDQLRKRARDEALRHHKSATPDPGTELSTATEERVADPAGSLLDTVWNEEWQQNLVGTALEKIKTQVRPKHYQIFYLLMVKQLSPSRVAKALHVNVGQVYLVKHRVGGLFKKALRDIEAKTAERTNGSGQSNRTGMALG